MDGYKKSSQVVFDVKIQIICVTKYRCKVLQGRIAERARELIRQGYETRGITILQGSVGKEHIHSLLSIPPSIASSKLLQYLKGRKVITRRVSEILGTTFMGERILCCECWNSDGGNQTKQYRQSVK